jgi:hypothetical protein
MASCAASNGLGSQSNCGAADSTLRIRRIHQGEFFCARQAARRLNLAEARRMWLRGLESAKKRYLLTAAGNNLGLVMRQLLGSGKPENVGDAVV